MTASEGPATEAKTAERCASDDRSAVELLAQLVGETSGLVRRELGLLKAELGHNLARAGRGVIALAVGTVLVISAWCTLLAAACLALSLFVPPWLAALFVAAASLAAGAGLVYLGKRRLDVRSLAPRRALRSLREDAAWLKELGR